MVNEPSVFEPSKFYCTFSFVDSQWKVTPSLDVVRALVILGSGMQCFTIVFSIVKLCVRKEQQKLFKAAGGFAIFSGRLNYSYKNQKHYSILSHNIGRSSGHHR